MNLSKETIVILKNFANINNNLLIKEGSTLSTKNQGANLFVEAIVGEKFPSNFGIYDLNVFLGSLALFSNPDLDFQEKFVTISENKNTVKFYAANEQSLVVPQKTMVFPEPTVSFGITSTQLEFIKKSSVTLTAKNLSFVGEKGKNITMFINDKKNPTANSSEVILGKSTQTFTVNILIEYLQMLAYDYTVDVAVKKGKTEKDKDQFIVRFTNKDSNYIFYTGAEADTTINK